MKNACVYNLWIVRRRRRKQGSGGGVSPPITGYGFAVDSGECGGWQMTDPRPGQRRSRMKVKTGDCTTTTTLLLPLLRCEREDASPHRRTTTKGAGKRAASAADVYLDFSRLQTRWCIVSAKAQPL